MPSTVLRYFELSGGSTAVDDDPSVTQPGETAMEQGGANPLPLVSLETLRTNAPIVRLTVLDDDGVIQESDGRYAVSMVERREATCKPPTAAGSRTGYEWHRGVTATNVDPGELLVQEGFTPGATVSVVITGSTGAPSAGWLKIEVGP